MNADARVALHEALVVPDHPLPIVHFARTDPPKAHVSWQNGAHMTMRWGPSSVHFEELSSAVGKAHPTGLYSAVVSRLWALFTCHPWFSWVQAVTCEPATAWATAILARRGDWAPLFGTAGTVWVWWMRPATADAGREALELVRAVQAERVDE